MAKSVYHFTCVEHTQHKIACGLTADHINLQLAGMVAPCQVQRQLVGHSAMEAMPPSPRGESLLKDRTDSSATIIARRREDNREDNI